MAAATIERKLAAIISADVVDWSRLMDEEEAGTLAALKRHREELIDPKIAAYGGCIVGTAGDALLIEYPSAVDAVGCSIDIQCAMTERNADLPEERRMAFRVGINIGEVIVDGVNIAARIKGICQPGGICMSGKVHDEVQGKLDAAFEDLGEKNFKSIARPIPVYALTPADDAPAQVGGRADALALPSKPSIAVLPFDNMSDDQEQGNFADGIADDILTGLSCFHDLFVTARNFSFTYKGAAVDIKQVGRELGVRYVLEGGVRKAGNRVRITAQLIEAESGNHLWAEKYDGELADIFDLQDEITASVVGVIQPTVFLAEIERAKRKRTENMDAYDLLLRGWSAFFRLTSESLAAARVNAQAALATDPIYAPASTLVAWVNFGEFIWGWSADPGATLTQARQAADEAIMRDESDANAHAALSYCHLVARNFDQALAAANRAIDLNPNLAMGHFARCGVNGFTGVGEAGLKDIYTALRLSPRDPFRFGFLNVKIICHIAMRDHEAGLEAASQLVTLRPDYIFGPSNMAVCCAHLGRIEQAQRALEETVRVLPAFDRAFIDAAWPWQTDEDMAHLIEGLRLAGWEG